MDCLAQLRALLQLRCTGLRCAGLETKFLTLCGAERATPTVSFVHRAPPCPILQDG